jgi:O-antigen/teichoic acid export membrane protein
LGFDSAHIKRISEGKDIGECIGTFISIKIALAAVFGSITIGAIFFWKYILHKGFESPTHEIAVYIILGGFILDTITQSMNSTFNARQEIAKAQLPVLFQTATRVAITIFVAISGLGVIALAYTYVAGEIVFFIFSLIFFRGYIIKKPSKKIAKSYTHFSFPLIIGTAANIIVRNADRVFIQLFWTATQVGYYFASMGISTFIDMFTTGVATLLFPNYSALHAKKDFDGIRKLTMFSERYMSMISFPITLGLVSLASPAVHILLSDKYEPAIPILQILPFFAILNALSRPYGNLLMGMNRPDLARNQTLLQAIVNIILNIFLIPKDIQILHLQHLPGLGAIGAAIAAVIACAVGLIYARYLAWKIVGVKGSLRIVIHLFASIIMGIILYLISINFSITRWYYLLAIGFLGLGIYFLVLWLCHEFTKNDFNFFLDTLNIKKMLLYIRKETRNK